ncbi:hypothetical protein I79_005266 [Cricetulus griseus]|uniref:Uncharacterized protein n=1 Tax=Cricetulus griseus TaxID=10029 RepID=G3H4Q9_CRIGR|nr:hypothetical protein I79_005266 [Cricetulus griseus]
MFFTFSNVMKRKFAQTITSLAGRKETKFGVAMPVFFTVVTRKIMEKFKLVYSLGLPSALGHVIKADITLEQLS